MPFRDELFPTRAGTLRVSIPARSVAKIFLLESVLNKLLSILVAIKIRGLKLDLKYCM